MERKKENTDNLEDVAEDEHEEVDDDITLEVKNTDETEELKQMTKTQLKIILITIKLLTMTMILLWRKIKYG